MLENGGGGKRRKRNSGGQKKDVVIIPSFLFQKYGARREEKERRGIEAPSSFLSFHGDFPFLPYRPIYRIIMKTFFISSFYGKSEGGAL